VCTCTCDDTLSSVITHSHCTLLPILIPDADKDSDEEGLFADSDDDDAAAASARKPVLTKKERMEALTKKKRQEHKNAATATTGSRAASNTTRASGSGGGGADTRADGYESEDSYNSADFVRTQADNDFIDTEGDDADAVAELYADQHFDDEREEAMEEPRKKKKIKGAGSDRGRSERQELEAEADDDNPIMQAVKKMARKKRVQKKFSEIEEEARPFVARMIKAAELDEVAIAKKLPATNKLSMLNEVCETLAKRDMTRPLLDLDVLAACKKWIQPLPNGTLGNVTVRTRLLTAIALMTGENGITPHDLKRSEFGKVVMSLYMHKSETRETKVQLKALIDQWSRPIFQKSGNMRDLERVHHLRGDTGIARFARSQQMDQPKVAVNPARAQHRGGKDQDLNSLIQSGSKGKTESGINRVRVPYSKGFQYSVRPESRLTGDVADKRRLQSTKSFDARGKLGKRMLEKGRAVTKNVRSANVSVEGRVSKP
jgi:transcription factor SPN1